MHIFRSGETLARDHCAYRSSPVSTLWTTSVNSKGSRARTRQLDNRLVTGYLDADLLINLRTRLAQLGLDVNNLAQSGKLGGCLFTRAFGHAILKGTLLSYPNLLVKRGSALA